MTTYRKMMTAEVTTRDAARLVGIPRATATRKPTTTRAPAVVAVPANKLSTAERTKILAVAISKEFVDLPPIQI